MPEASAYAFCCASDTESPMAVAQSTRPPLVTMSSPLPSFNINDLNIDLSKIAIPSLTIAAGLDRVSEVMGSQSFHGTTNYSKVANITPKVRLRQITPASPSQGSKRFSVFAKF